MKTTTLVLILFLAVPALLRAQMPTVRRPLPTLPAPAAPAAAPNNAPPEEMIPTGTIDFEGVDVDQVLEVYAKLVGRTLLRATLPQTTIILKTETPLTKTEAIQALQAVLALNGISVVNVGEKFVKVLPSDVANTAAAALDFSGSTNLPELGSYITHIVQLKYVKPSLMVPLLTPFSKLPNAAIAIDDNGILVLRDYAENVKRMLEMIDQIDISVPAEYISEVIPIRYAQAEDIANALNSLGSGGSTVSFGSSGTTQPINGLGSRSGTAGTPGGYQSGQSGQFGGMSNPNQSRQFGGQATPNGTPSSGMSFGDRLRSIISKASSSGTDQIQVFGQTKIIADERSNSLLVFATRQDMENIRHVISQLDVLLAQVLIESVIVDVSLNKALNFGVSAAQNPRAFSPAQQIAGGGGFNNGNTFFNFLGSNSSYSIGSNSSSIFGNALPGGLSYFGNIGPTWDVAMSALASDNSATVIQRPRIQTSQAKAASFFVGQTVPYVTGSTYGSAYGNSSSYSQLSVGVELDVTPFINPDGLVVMDIQQEIDDLNGYTVIQNVGNVPNTTKRQLSSEIAVKDRDTIMLGGFVRSDKSKQKSGVPLLQDIPLLGNLFTSRSDTKDRSETIVLIRPTVLKTPELAAAQALKEEERLPGIAHAQVEDDADVRKQIQANRKAERLLPKSAHHENGLFAPPRVDDPSVDKDQQPPAAAAPAMTTSHVNSSSQDDSRSPAPTSPPTGSSPPPNQRQDDGLFITPPNP